MEPSNMSRFATVSLAVLVLVGVFATMNTNEAAPKPEKVLRHVVLFKFKADATEQQIQEVVDAFGTLPEKIDAIHDFEWGTDVSPEGKAQGFTHCFLVTFRNEQGRDEYLPHAEHQAFVTLVRPVLEDVLVVDYWTPQP
jgi:hypothetical protein